MRTATDLTMATAEEAVILTVHWGLASAPLKRQPVWQCQLHEKATRSRGTVDCTHLPHPEQICDTLSGLCPGAQPPGPPHVRQVFHQWATA